MEKLSLVIPKGSIYESTIALLRDSGIQMKMNERTYRPMVSDDELEIKIMRPQNIPELIELGSHDAGFTGNDWIVETGVDVVTVMQLGLDPVRIIAAIPETMNEKGLKQRRIVVASEYENISRKFLDEKGFDYVFLRTYGATEVFPPDDADMIIDNTSTGRTLREHKLKVYAELLNSSTCFIANKKTSQDAKKAEKLEELRTLFKSVLDARSRVMLEMNIPEDKFNAIIPALPCMRAPTVAALHAEQGYAVKIAVNKDEVAKLIPKLKRLGATDILEYELRKVVP